MRHECMLSDHHHLPLADAGFSSTSQARSTIHSVEVHLNFIGLHASFDTPKELHISGVGFR